MTRPGRARYSPPATLRGGCHLCRGRFLAGLEFTLTHGLNEERRAALRQTVEAITWNSDVIDIAIRVLPMSDMPSGSETVRATV